MGKKPTQRELAQQLGVSQTAISLTINDPDSKAVTSEKRKVILDYLREIDYPLPDNTKRRVIWVLACLGFSSRRQYLDEVLKGAREEASRREYRVVVQHSEAPVEHHEIPEEVKGIIWFADPREEVIASWSTVRPVVMLNWASGQCPCDSIMPANAEAMRIATMHLRGLGHTRIAYMGWEPKHWNRFHVLHARERLEGFRRAMNYTSDDSMSDYVVHVIGDESHLPWHDPALVPGVLDRWMNLPEPPTAAVTFNDGIAVRMTAAAAARGMRLPEDFSVVGVDNNHDYVFGTPALTTIEHPWRYMARQAVQRLLARIDGDDEPTMAIRVKPKLIIRDSTSSPARRRA